VNKLKGQGGMLEHILLATFILIIVIVSVFFIFGFEFGRQRTEQSVDQLREEIFLTNYLMISPLLAKEDRVLDDTKLINFVSESGCNDIRNALDREKICVEIEKVLLPGERVQPCFEDYRPECNSWQICEETCLELKDKSMIIESPINIFKKLENTYQLGLIRVRLPLEE